MVITINKTIKSRTITQTVTIDTSKCRDVDEIKEALSMALSMDGCDLGIIAKVFGFDESKLNDVLG